MHDVDPNLSFVKRICESLFQEGQGLFSWQWDPYFGAVLSVVQADGQQRALQLLQEQCGPPLDAQTLSSGPDDVRAVLDQFGGLRTGQRAFLSSREEPTFVLVAWWPWGNGASVSIRVRLLRSPGVAIDENDALNTTFRGWFGL